MLNAVHVKYQITNLKIVFHSFDIVLCLKHLILSFDKEHFGFFFNFRVNSAFATKQIRNHKYVHANYQVQRYLNRLFLLPKEISSNIF